MGKGCFRCNAVAWAVLAVWLGGCQQFTAALPKFGNNSNTAYKAPPQAKPEWSATVKPEQEADVQMALARSLESQGQSDQAVKVYLDVVKKDGKRADAYHRLAILHDLKGDHDAARKYYQIALKKDPKNAELHCDLGYSWYLQQRWKEAESSLRRAVELAPDLARAHNNLGMLLAHTGRDNEALREFHAAGLTEAAARSNLAFAMAVDNRWTAAQGEYEHALAVDPHSKPARDGLTAMQKLNLAGPSPSLQSSAPPANFAAPSPSLQSSAPPANFAAPTPTLQFNAPPASFAAPSPTLQSSAPPANFAAPSPALQSVAPFPPRTANPTIDPLVNSSDATAPMATANGHFASAATRVTFLAPDGPQEAPTVSDGSDPLASAPEPSVQQGACLQDDDGAIVSDQPAASSAP